MAVTIPAGELNRRVEVRVLSATPDASGHVDETDDSNWIVIARRWCKLTPRGSREFFRGQQVAAEITHQVTMRFDSESRRFTTGNQLKMDDRKFNISGPPVNVEEAGVLYQFPAVEVK